MYTLTVKQPWAALIVNGIKDIENRTWRPYAKVLGQRIAIHAGATIDKKAVKRLKSQGVEIPDMTTSAFVGTVVVEEAVTESQSSWWIGPIGWILSDAKKLNKPLPSKGKLGLWKVSDDITARLKEQGVT